MGGDAHHRDRDLKDDEAEQQDRRDATPAAAPGKRFTPALRGGLLLSRTRIERRGGDRQPHGGRDGGQKRVHAQKRRGGHGPLVGGQQHEHEHAKRVEHAPFAQTSHPFERVRAPRSRRKPQPGPRQHADLHEGKHHAESHDEGGEQVHAALPEQRHRMQQRIVLAALDEYRDAQERQQQARHLQGKRRRQRRQPRPAPGSGASMQRRCRCVAHGRVHAAP